MAIPIFFINEYTKYMDFLNTHIKIQSFPPRIHKNNQISAGNTSKYKDFIKLRQVERKIMKKNKKIIFKEVFNSVE